MLSRSLSLSLSRSLALSLSLSLSLSQKALDLAYERVSTLYLYRLVVTKKKELEKRWGRDVGQKVTQDAQHLHKTFSDLVRARVQHSTSHSMVLTA